MKNIPLPERSDAAFIRKLIIAFFNENMHSDFHGKVLYKYVVTRLNKYIYPDTIFRMMRQLRQDYIINYTTVSIAKSLYHILPK